MEWHGEQIRRKESGISKVDFYFFDGFICE